MYTQKGFSIAKSPAYERISSNGGSNPFYDISRTLHDRILKASMFGCSRSNLPPDEISSRFIFLLVVVLSILPVPLGGVCVSVAEMRSRVVRRSSFPLSVCVVRG